MSLSLNYSNVRPTLNLDFANTKQLDPRITFTRNSTASYYDGFSTAKAEENLLTTSSFSSSSVQNGTRTANVATAPDSTTTATSFVPDAVLNRHIVYITSTASSSMSNTNITLSCFLKANGYNYAQVVYYKDGGGGVDGIIVDLTNGTITTTNGTPVSSSVTSVGSGWYRAAITINTSFTTSIGLIVAVSDSGTPSSYTAGSPSFTGNGTSGIYIWGAQVEQRSTVTAHTPTTTAPITNYIPVLQTAAANVARFDHNPITKESLGLLIEESRANLFTNSTAFNWSETSTVAGTALSRYRQVNAAVAPDGTITATKISASPDLDQQRLYISGIANVTLSSPLTYSIYAKAAEYSRVGIKMSSDASTALVVDLSNGSIVQNGNATSQSVTSVGNGWYRISITFTPTVSPVPWVELFQGLNDSFTGDGYSGIYIWGAQLEQGLFPTSYIATTSAQVTRSADAASMTGTNFSSWYSASAGSLYVEYSRSVLDSSRASHYVGINDGTSNNSIVLYSNNSQLIQSDISVSGTTQGILSSTVSVTTNALVKQSIVYSLNDVAMTANGTTPIADTSALIPAVTQMTIGNRPAGDRNVNSYIRKIYYYPVRITNAQLQAITS